MLVKLVDMLNKKIYIIYIKVRIGYLDNKLK